MPSRKRSTSIKKRLSMLKFSVDDLVFAKHQKLVDWPGKILGLPDEEDGKKYKVHLFGVQKEISAPEKNLANFEGSYDSCGCPTGNEERNSALWEALFDPFSLGLQRPQDLTAVLKEAFESKENLFTNQQQTLTATTQNVTPAEKPSVKGGKTRRSTRKSADLQPHQDEQKVDSKKRKKPLAETLPPDHSSSTNQSASTVNLGTPERPAKPPLTPLFSPSASHLVASAAATIPITPVGRRSTCLALKVPNNTPLSPPKSKRTTRGVKRCSQEPQDALNDASLFMEKIQALEQKQKSKRRSK